ncbi:MAG: cyclic nucleotide-binding domain-containing protein [Bacteriovoracaceae bacterium]|nr:cyclic nucleotide-binding domain-containing protein [Bacteriovoracaceae bacterium]
MKKTLTVLLVEDVDPDFEVISSVLQSANHRVVRASTGPEARLKITNQEFNFIIINMDIKGVGALEFVQQVRETEQRKNVKERIPILVNGSNAESFEEDFSQIDNIQYLARPFTALEFKEKMTSFRKKASIKKENTRLIPKGDYLITEGGGKSQEMYWVLSGKFIITKLNKENQNVVIGEVNQGELLGELSFLDSLPRSASVKASEDCEVLVIPHRKFMDVLDSQPRWFRSLLTTLSHRLRDADQRIAQKFVTTDEDKKDL